MTTVTHHSCSSLNGVFLPEDIVTEILLRLPVKSILRFVSVCCLWRTIIRSQRFTRDQFQESNPTTGLVVYWHRYSSFAYYNFPLCSLFPDAKLQICEELDYRILLGAIQSMCGPCYGVLCLLCEDKSFVFWNPTTRALRTVPLCPHDQMGNDTDFGFGINPLTDDLKIVLINKRCFGSQFAAVYNSRDNSWSLYEDETLCDTGTRFKVLTNEYARPFSNGFCYWIKYDRRTGQSAIHAFDMRNNSFQEIEMPANVLKPYSSDKAKLDLYNDALALVKYSPNGGRVETWFMKEPGCWEKLSCALLSFEIYEPIGILNRNEIFVSDANENLFIYDADSFEVCKRKLEYKRVEGDFTYKLFARPYKESITLV